MMTEIRNSAVYKASQYISVEKFEGNELLIPVLFQHTSRRIR